jgi:hypothetical protein
MSNQIEFKVGNKVKVKNGSMRLGKSGIIMKDYKDGDFKVNFGGNDDVSIDGKNLVLQDLP